VAWSVVSGALPTGLRLSSSTGTISGTPTGFGTSNFTIEAVDHSPSPQTATKAFSLTVDQADPTITRISPSTGASAGGTKVTVTGHFLNGGSITFGGVAGNDTTVNTSGTSLVTYTPAGTAGTTVDVDLTTPGGSADAGDAFTYQGPTITRLSASSGPGNGGTRVTITGTFLQGATAVTFGGTAAASYTVSSAGTSITAYTPAEQADGPVDVTVTTPGGGSATDAGSFTFLAPTESRLSPTSGPADVSTKVTIAGADLQGTSAVSFGGVAAASYSVNSSGTSLVAYTPTTVGAGMVDVLVTTPGGTLDIPNGFTFGAPTVTRVNPDTGPAGGGAKVTITGTFLAGTEAVSFGGVGWTGLTVNGTGTSLTVDTPTYGLSGAQAVEVYTPNGTIDAGTYTFEPPTVSHVSPSSGPAYTSDTVTITGTNLTGASAVTFGGVEATSYTVNPAGTSISAVTPSSVGPGTVAVQVTTVGGTSSATVTPYDRFTFG